VAAGQPTPAEVAVVHPNDTGFELNQITLIYIPPHFVRQLRLSYGGQPLLDAELDFSIAENPTLRFHFVPEPGERELRAEVLDSRDGRYSGSLAVRG
jgi:sulfur-oxidizing protein SoxY